MKSQYGLNYDWFLLLMRCIKYLAIGRFGNFILDKHPKKILFVATSGYGYYLLT